MNRWVTLGMGAVLLAVAAVAVKGCDAKTKTGGASAPEGSSSTKGGAGEPGKGDIKSLFGMGTGDEPQKPVVVPGVKLNPASDEVLGKAVVLAVVEANEREMDLAFFDAEGKKLANLTSDGIPKMQASLSHDRKWVTFLAQPEVKPGPRMDIYVASLDGKNLYLLTKDFPKQDELVESRNQGRGAKVRANFSPTFTSDDRDILFTSSVIGDPRNFFTVRRDGSEGATRQQITKAEGKAEILKYTSPDCSPAGDEVVFSRHVGRSSHSICKMNRQTGEEKELVTGESSWLDNPRFSPDGKKIAYTERAEKSSQFWLHVVDPDGTNDRKLNPQESIQSRSFAYSWSADGTRIYFSRSDGKQEDLQSIDVATGTITPFTKTTETEVGPLSLK